MTWFICCTWSIQLLQGFFDPRKYNWIELKGYSRLKKVLVHLALDYPSKHLISNMKSLPVHIKSKWRKYETVRLTTVKENLKGLMSDLWMVPPMEVFHWKRFLEITTRTRSHTKANACMFRQKLNFSFEMGKRKRCTN